MCPKADVGRPASRPHSLSGTRVPGKLDSFDGASECGDLSFKFKSYMAALDARYAGIFKNIDSSTVPLSNLALQPEDESLPT